MRTQEGDGHMPFSFTTVDTGLPGATFVAVDINNRGEIVLQRSDVAPLQAYVYDSGIISQLNFPTALSITVEAINNKGEIAGSLLDTQPFKSLLFIDHNGAFQTFSGLPSANLFGINDRDQAVGFQGRDGLLFDGRTGAITTIDYPVSSYDSLTGINDRGEIVGSYSNTGASHGFFYFKGIFKNIDVPGATQTEPQAINSRGDIVGSYQDASGNWHGFIEHMGTFETIDAPGAKSTFASGLNDNGTVVGNYTDTAGSHVFLASPTLDHWII